MHNQRDKLLEINKEIHNKIKELNFLNYNPKVIAVSKTFSIDKIQPLIDMGHSDFGENRVQEAYEKWNNVKNEKIKLHLIGKLQTNKVKIALNIFDYIHSLDSEKLANKISDEQKKNNKKLKYFIQINLGQETQKSGINKNEVESFFKYCTEKLSLNVIGTMCLPPFGENPDPYFSELKEINKSLNLRDLSMGMSDDYLNALKYGSTYLRIGSKIFGKRNQ
tara:strand:- start:514 stop:1176 length:663 start_codon:yes stop_codon:yes gene_type:complete